MQVAKSSFDPKYEIGSRIEISTAPGKKLRCTIIRRKLKHLYKPRSLTTRYFLYTLVDDNSGKIHDVAEGHLGPSLKDKTEEEINSILTKYAVR
jgi:hypothetical protein